MEKTSMSTGEQLVLFEKKQSTWAERFWRETDPRARRKVIVILATMAKACLNPNPEGRSAGESVDES